METNQRQRFFKPYHFLTKGMNDPFESLREVFQIYHLHDFREEITSWKDLALSNDQSAYGEGGEREDLIEFCTELVRLAEALYIIHEKKNRKYRKKVLKNLSKEVKALLKEDNRPVLLSDQEAVKPQLVIKDFCKRFSDSYVKIELLDMLEAVITYTGEKEIYKGQLVLFYQCIKYLTTFAFLAMKNTKILIN